MARPIDLSLQQYVPGQIWLKKYAVRFAGCDLFARTTFIRLSSGALIVHSPGPIDGAVEREVAALGRPAYLVAPGNFHHLHVPEWQTAFPDAQAWICPGVEARHRALASANVLADQPPAAWKDEVDQVFVAGTRLMREVAFFHRASRTLILTDLIENIGPDSEGTSRALELYWKLFRMWGKPTPAPEYRVLGWGDRAVVRRCLERILTWDIERVVVAHGQNIEMDPKAVLREAWASALR